MVSRGKMFRMHMIPSLVIMVVASSGYPLLTAMTMKLGSNLDQDCIERCNSTGHRVECIDCIPNPLHSSIYHVVLSHFNNSQLLPGIFCEVSWPNVTNLAIISNSESLLQPDVKYFIIANYTFNCLHKIYKLKLVLPMLTSLSLNAFYGLPNLKVLDLTDCTRLNIPEVIIGLTVATNIPNLQTLILRNLGSVFEGIELSEEIIDIVARRRISMLDMSYSTVGIKQNADLYRLCDSLETLILSHTHFLRTDFPETVTVCNSLRLVDFSAAEFLQGSIRILKGNITIKQAFYHFDKLWWFPIIKKVSVIYINNLLPPGLHISILNLTFHMSLENSLTEMHISGYSVPVFEVIFKFDYNFLRYLDLSHNAIQQLSPFVFSYLEELRIIDLSHNSLADSKQFDTLFNNLFQNNAKLENVSLAFNGLTYLPSGVFESNSALKYLDLSGNKLKQITFVTPHLSNLERVDLSNNLIKYFNSWSRAQIDSLYRNRNQETIVIKQKPDISFTIGLTNNPFSCQCSAFEFIEWFNQSPVFKDAKHQLHCNSDSKQVPMNETAVEVAKYACDEPKRRLRKLLLIVLLPCTLLGGIVLISVFLYKRNRKRKRYRELSIQTALIHNNDYGFRFPVFLSYASDDSEFVAFNIHRSLQSKLQVLTGSDRDLVAVGDRYFRVGRSIFAEIVRLLEDCAVFVVVLSKNYCNSEYCKHEIEQARLMRKPMVLILKEYVEENKMNGVIKDVFKHYTRMKVELEGDNLMLQQDWEYICESIILLV